MLSIALTKIVSNVTMSFPQQVLPAVVYVREALRTQALFAHNLTTRV